MSKTILNADELQLLEQRCANQLGEETLMNRAGEAVANLIEERSPGKRITVLVGPGNNGGDALATARILRSRDFNVTVVLPGGQRPTSELALTQFNAWCAMGESFVEDPYMTEKADCVVDGLFGTGLQKPITGDYLDAVLWFNERQALKVSLDIPSGLNALTGQWIGSYPGCRADITVGFLCAKAGYYMNEGVDATGEIFLAELDVSVPLTSLSVVEEDEFPHLLNKRDNNTHKGSFGHVAVIGGDTGKIGAAMLAARAALEFGAGAVTAEFLSKRAPAVDPIMPEIMFSDDPIDFNAYSATVIGCGLGTSDHAKARLISALQSQKPLIIDADALNLIAADIKLQDMVLARQAHTVLTPHPKEAARLLRREVAGVIVDRVAAARELAVQTGAIVVLKGAGTVISLRSSRSWINPTGNGMLATAGSGDVLAGMIGSLFAQGYDMVEAVLGAVYFHGLSAQNRAAGFVASDITPAANAYLEELRLQ